MQLSARLQDDEKPKIAETITFPDPHDNKQDKEALLKEHIARTGGVVVTRFPPEPNVCSSIIDVGTRLTDRNVGLFAHWSR